MMFFNLSQQSTCKNVNLESILNTVDDNGLCKIGLKFVSSLPVKFKSGVLFREALPYYENVKVLDDSPPVIKLIMSLYLIIIFKCLLLSLWIISQI